MPNVPLVRELEALAPQFFHLLQEPLAVGSISGPKLTVSEDPTAMYTGGVDTRIFVRSRPVLRHEPDPATTVRRVEGYRNCVFISPEVTVAGRTSITPTSIPVDATFTDQDPNEQVYSTTCNGLVPLALDGGSAAVLCYGQTGSGKTHTTTGILRCVAREMAPLITPQMNVCVSFIEVRAEGCRDLLTGADNVLILEDKTGVVNVHNVKEVPVRSEREMVELTAAAIASRSTKTTERNQSGSSRSHMAARFLIRRVDTPWVAPGTLCFVDLAGSESASDAVGHDKERIQETRFINSSLMTLKECIRARGQACVTTKHVHVPFRQSKLTLLLRDSFELIVQRKTKTALIACVSPLLRDARHTYNTLRYAGLLYVSPKTGVVVEKHENDPSTWTRDQALEFISTCTRGRVRDPTVVLPAGDGRALVQLPESEFVARVVQCGMGEKAAKEAYGRVWKAVVDAKKHLRKNIQKARVEATAKREGRIANQDPGPAPTTPRRPSARGGHYDDETVIYMTDGSGEGTQLANPPVHVDGRGPPASSVSKPPQRRSLSEGIGRRPRAVTAELADEKENDTYLEDMTRQMASGYARYPPSRRR